MDSLYSSSQIMPIFSRSLHFTGSGAYWRSSRCTKRGLLWWTAATCCLRCNPDRGLGTGTSCEIQTCQRWAFLVWNQISPRRLVFLISLISCRAGFNSLLGAQNYRNLSLLFAQYYLSPGNSHCRLMLFSQTVIFELALCLESRFVLWSQKRSSVFSSRCSLRFGLTSSRRIF